jgi:hypothetical protein
MTVAVLNPVSTLRELAERFLASGQESAAYWASRMADDCADLNGWKPGAGDALYKNWTLQLIQRAENTQAREAGSAQQAPAHDQ